MNELQNYVKKIGSLRDMNAAVRLIENKGYTVTGWDGLNIEVLNCGTLEYEEIEGRVWPK